MDLSKITPDLTKALGALGKSRQDKAFPIKTSVHVVLRKHDQEKRRGRASLKKLILPENCAAVLEHLPAEEGNRTHAIIAGDFIFCDLLIAIARARPGGTLSISTLSLSRKNVDALAAALERRDITRFDLILSHYFQSTSRELFASIEKTLSARTDVRVAITRTHCKLALFDSPGLVPLTIESSANLRSSGNLEHVTLFADQALYDFHLETFSKMLP